MSALLELSGLTRRYAGLLAVDGVDMQVAAGSIHALIGPNGAGKTTLFNLISGLVAPSAGTIHLASVDVTALGAHLRARLRLARTFQNIRIFGAMTVRENVLTGLHAHFSTERAAGQAAEAALEWVGLAEVSNRRATTLSYGDQRRLELARAIAPAPVLLLLDEPAAGMNPAETAELAALIRDLPARGTTVLLVEHDMHFVMGLADEITVLNFGRCICVGRPEVVRADPQVIEAYLGHNTNQAPAATAATFPGEPILKVAQLRVTYGRTTALKGIDLTVRSGQVVCLIGANGAGKTTAMRTLSGLVRPAAGRITFADHDITGLSPARIAASGLLHVPEGRQIFPELTVEENLTLGAYLLHDTAERARRRTYVLHLFPRLRERLAQQAGLMSGGEQQMLAMGRALMGGPKMLLLDEPSMGLAPLLIDEIFAIITKLKQEGTTILLVEQNAAAALAVADYAYVLETGRVVIEGPAAEVATNPAIVAAYLGG
jgi:ABC-type branched-subunit amino acid transport system ATPase component